MASLDTQVGEEEEERQEGLQGLFKNPEKRTFVAPKPPVPVERRRQRSQKPGDENRVPAIPTISSSLPSEQITGRQIVDLTINSAWLTSAETAALAHSVTVYDRVKTCEQERQEQEEAAEWRKNNKKVHNQCGFFRQILSEEEVIYDMPNHYKSSPEPLPVEEAIYTEPSLRSVCSSTLTGFGQRRPTLGAVASSGDDDVRESSHYADAFERCVSLLDHNYEEMDFDEDECERHPFPLPIESSDNTESGFSDGSKSSRPEGYSSSDSGASLTIPPGLARSRAALFESIAQANRRVISPRGSKRLVQALGPQLALYSMNSLPPAEVFQSIRTKSKSCPPSLNAVNWSMDACVENDGFFMEFANQRIALPDPASPTTSCSSLPSGSEASSAETELTDRSKSSRKVSFVLGPGRSTTNRLLCHKVVVDEEDPPLTARKGKSISSTSTSSSAAVNFARFFKQTLTVIGRCSTESQISDNDSLISHPADDLLSQSDLEMFCKSSSEKRLRKDSGMDMTSPDASLCDSTLDMDDIDAALAILEIKAKAKSRHASNKPTEAIQNVGSDACSSSSDGSDMDSSSCSSTSSCESSCNLTDCSSWTGDCCWTSEHLTSSDVSESNKGEI